MRLVPLFRRPMPKFAEFFQYSIRDAFDATLKAYLQYAPMIFQYSIRDAYDVTDQIYKLLTQYFQYSIRDATLTGAPVSAETTLVFQYSIRDASLLYLSLSLRHYGGLSILY